jgi:hypothetical protein
MYIQYNIPLLTNHTHHLSGKMSLSEYGRT